VRAYYEVFVSAYLCVKDVWRERNILGARPRLKKKKKNTNGFDEYAKKRDGHSIIGECGDDGCRNTSSDSDGETLEGGTRAAAILGAGDARAARGISVRRLEEQFHRTTGESNPISSEHVDPPLELGYNRIFFMEGLFYVSFSLSSISLHGRFIPFY